MHFFEKLEREIDYTNEYKKIEAIICEERIFTDEYDFITINGWIEKNFSKWKRRRAYTSFDEVRKQCGFSSERLYNPYNITYVTMEKYILYSEMVINIVFDLIEIINMPQELSERFLFVLNTIKANLLQMGMELKKNNGEIIIVEKNATAIEIADKVPELADFIIEYNHYLIKGNLDRKQAILKKISDALEPKRGVLSQIDKSKTDDYFCLVNDMNIRHNNIDPQGKQYNAYFAGLSPDDKEEWYDLIYEQGLMLFMLLEQQKRNEKIKTYKEQRDKE